VEIELRDGPLKGVRRQHPLHPQLFGEINGEQVHVWQWQNPQAWAPPDRSVPVTITWVSWPFPGRRAA